ncbi:MAG TPA: hypothetical protein VKV39_14290 [Candidatus Sulfotelmatobacter sp.]|nr:hypothetical protein [Candidatus Sulfotelmatobacter sp.]
MAAHSSATKPVEQRNRGPVAPSEMRCVVCLGLAICLVTSIPYVLGNRIAPAGTRFSNVLVYEKDQNNYLAYAHQAASGQWLFHNPMTAEPHGNVFFNLEWLATGKMAALFRVSAASAMQIQRWMAILFLCFAVYWLSAYLVESVAARRVALAVVMLGGGFGWLVMLRRLGLPVNVLYFPDFQWGVSSPFYWSLRVPHFAVAQALIVLGLVFFLRAERNGRALDFIWSGLCYAAAGTCRTYDMLSVLLATGLFVCLMAWQERDYGRHLRMRIIPILVCMPVLAYYVWLFKVHPVFRWWSQAGADPPNPFVLGLAFGLPALLVWPALWLLRRNHVQPAQKLMICCAASACALTYAHWIFHFSFSFSVGICVPLVMIVVSGFEKRIAAWPWRGARGWGLPVALIALNSLTSVAILAQSVLFVSQGYFRLNEELLGAFAWLDAHSPADSVVLADYETSNLMPQYTHNRMFCGYYNAVRFEEKQGAVNRFFDPGSSNKSRGEFLEQNRIDFVLLVNGKDQALAKVGSEPYLQEIFRNGAATIYRVVRPGENFSAVVSGRVQVNSQSAIFLHAPDGSCEDRGRRQLLLRRRDRGRDAHARLMASCVRRSVKCCRPYSSQGRD